MSCRLPHVLGSVRVVARLLARGAGFDGLFSCLGPAAAVAFLGSRIDQKNNSLNLR